MNTVYLLAHPSLRDWSAWFPFPGVETPGYYRKSLRDKKPQQRWQNFVPALEVS